MEYRRWNTEEGYFEPAQAHAAASTGVAAAPAPASPPVAAAASTTTPPAASSTLTHVTPPHKPGSASAVSPSVLLLTPSQLMGVPKTPASASASAPLASAGGGASTGVGAGAGAGASAVEGVAKSSNKRKPARKGTEVLQFQTIAPPAVPLLSPHTLSAPKSKAKSSKAAQAPGDVTSGRARTPTPTLAAAGGGYFAWSAFQCSPDPSALPMPSFH